MFITWSSFIISIVQKFKEVAKTLTNAISLWTQVSFEDVDRLKPVAQMENIRIPHFMQDQGKYAEQLTKIMLVNQLTEEELKTIV